MTADAARGSVVAARCAKPQEDNDREPTHAARSATERAHLFPPPRHDARSRSRSLARGGGIHVQKTRDRSVKKHHIAVAMAFAYASRRRGARKGKVWVLARTPRGDSGFHSYRTNKSEPIRCTDLAVDEVALLQPGVRRHHAALALAPRAHRDHAREVLRVRVVLCGVVGGARGGTGATQWGARPGMSLDQSSAIRVRARAYISTTRQQCRRRASREGATTREAGRVR